MVQLVSGALIELFPAQAGIYPLDAYRLVFAAQAVAIVAASAAYLTVTALEKTENNPMQR